MSIIAKIAKRSQNTYPYMPSKPVLDELKKHGCYPRVRIQELFTTKDVTFRLQHKSSTGGRFSQTLGESPIDHFPTREAVDKIWLDMLRTMRTVILHETLPELP